MPAVPGVVSVTMPLAGVVPVPFVTVIAETFVPWWLPANVSV